MSDGSLDCIVIGGGAAGLSTAWHLARRGRRVVLLEAAPDLGGLVSSYRFEGFAIEKFYHHFFPADRDLFEVVGALGLDEAVRYRRGSVGYLVDGVVYPLDTPWEILRFPALSFLDKVRLSRLVKAAQRAEGAALRELDRVPAVTWIGEVAGRRVLESFFLPLLRGKFGERMETISAAWLAARVALRSRGRSLLRGETLCYFDGGFQRLVDALVSDVDARCDVRTGTPVERIAVEDGRVRGVETREGFLPARAVVAALTPPLLTRLVDLPEEEAAALTSIEFQACTCALVGVRSSVVPVYWLNIDSESCPFDVLLEHNHLWDDPAYGCRMLYLAQYHARADDPAFRRDEAALQEEFLGGLAAHFGWRREDLLWWRCARSPVAGPIYRCGYLRDMPSHRTSIEGLWHASMAHSFPERSTADSLRQGRVVAQQVDEVLP